MRRLLVVPLLALAGCGGVSGDPLEPTLAFFPPDAPMLAVVDTDSGSRQRRALQRIAKRFPFSSQLVPQLQDPALAPVLGNPAVIGASDPRALSDRRKLVVAIRPRRPEKLSELRRRWVESGRYTLAGSEAGFRILRDSTGDLNAFDGETLVLSGSRPLLSNALRRGTEGEGIDADRFGEALDGVEGDSLVAVRLDADALAVAIPGGTRAQTGPFLGEVRTIGAKLIVRSNALEARFRMRTEDEVDPQDLPLAEGSASPSVVERPEEVGIAVRDPAQLLRFLRGAGAGLGTPRFEERVGIEFTRDFVKQLRGDAALSFVPGRGYAFRAQVRNPAAMRRTLANIARKAADAARRLQGDVISITPPRDGGGVYLLDRIGSDAAFGLFGDTLVFANSARRARAMARARGRKVPGARGALVVTARPEELRAAFVRQFAPAGGLGDAIAPSIFLRPLGRLDASVQAAPDGLTGRVIQRFD